MNGTVRFLIWGMIPAGAFAGGALSQTVGVRPALVVAGLGSIASSLPLLWSRLGALRAMPDACEPGV
jgi:hypothetical protein